MLPAAAARDASVLSPEALPGTAASRPEGRRRRPQDKRPGAKTPPGKGTACRKYFSRDFSSSPAAPPAGLYAGPVAPRRAEPWQRGCSRLQEEVRTEDGVRGRGGEGRQHPPGEVRGER